MPIQKTINGKIVHEVSMAEFKAGLFRLSGENQSIYSTLLQEFEKRALDEVIQTTRAKNLGKSKRQIVFERMRRREARKHHFTLNKNMREANQVRYAKTSAHHIVAWNDERASLARAILAQFGIGIDDAENGVMLPTGLKNTPHKELPNAYAHSTVHTKIYYANVTTLLSNASLLQNVTKEDIIATLQDIAQDLQQGVFPLQKPIGGR